MEDLGKRNEEKTPHDVKVLLPPTVFGSSNNKYEVKSTEKAKALPAGKIHQNLPGNERHYPFSLAPHTCLFFLQSTLIL